MSSREAPVFSTDYGSYPSLKDTQSCRSLWHAAERRGSDEYSGDGFARRMTREAGNK